MNNESNDFGSYDNGGNTFSGYNPFDQPGNADGSTPFDM